MNRQIIIQQENDLLIALVAQLDDAASAWVKAAETWESDPTMEAHAEALQEANEVYQEANRKLAQVLRSFWRTGYRLARPTEDE